MKDTSLKIIRIFCDTLENITGKKPDALSQLLGYSGQTIRNWLKEERSQKQPDVFCQKVRTLVENDKFPSDFTQPFIKNLKQEDIYIPRHIELQNNINTILEYLLQSYQNEQQYWATYKLLDKLEQFPMLEKILKKKLTLHAERYGFFKLESINHHSFTLKFWDLNQQYSYIVFVNYLSSEGWYNASSPNLAVVNSKRKDQYNADMILHLNFFAESDDTLYVCINDNIYIDYINVQQTSHRETGKDFVFSNITNDAENTILANRFTDIILSHLTKYFAVIYKNILFNKIQPSSENKNPWLLWNMKPAETAEMGFEHDILNNHIEKEPKDLLIILGFLSFPLIEKFSQIFKRIVCLDNSQKCITYYSSLMKSMLKSDPDRLTCKLEFSIFTSSIADYVTRDYELFGHADLVICGVGNASLFRSFKQYLRYINLWLKPNGKAWFSFFNESFPYDYQSRINLYNSSTYVPLPRENIAKVINTESRQRNSPDYHVYCKLYNDKTVIRTLGSYFKIAKVYSHPLLMLMTTGQPSFIRNIFSHYDYEYSKKGGSIEDDNARNYADFRGFYISAYVKKESELSACIPDFHEDAEFAQHHNHSGKLVNLKTVLLQEKNSVSKEYYVILLGKSEQLPVNSSGDIVLKNQLLRLLSVREINKLGFDPGNIPPFFSYDVSCNITLHKYYFPLDQYKNASAYQIESGNECTKIHLLPSQLQEYLKKYHYKKILF